MPRPIARLVLALPDRYEWWDDDDRGADANPDYPRYSLHGICSFLLLVERAEANAQPATAEVLLVANAGDQRLGMA